MVDHPHLSVENNWVFLTQAMSENEANIIESVLDSESIPVLRRYQEAGEYLKIYMGMTNFGIDIYVPESMLEQAQNVIDLNYTLDTGEEV